MKKYSLLYKLLPDRISILSGCIVTIAFALHGQPQAKIDSLLNVIANAGEDTTLANTMNSLSKEYRHAGEYDLANRYADSAMQVSVRINFKQGLANGYNNFGLIHLDQGMYPDAMENCKKGLEIFQELNNRTGIANSYSNIGIVNMRTGNFTGALENFYSCLGIMEDLGDKPGIARASNNIGMVFDAQGKYTEALDYYFASLKAKEELGDRRSTATTLHNIGSVYDMIGDRIKALEYFSNALKICQEFGDKSRIATNYASIGGIYLSLANYPKALENYEAALKIFEEIGNYNYIPGTILSMGMIYMFQRDYQRSRNNFNEGLSMSLEMGLKEEIKLAYEGLCRLDSAEGNFRQAFDHVIMYMVYKDSIFNEETSNEIMRMQIEYETEKKDKEIELLNKDNEIKALQLSRQRAIRHGLIAGVILLFIAGILLFRSFRLRKKLEQQQAIISERKRISADLHDDVGSGLSRIMLLTELVKSEAKTPEMKKESEKIALISRELSSNISEIIWALNANNDTLESLVAYIRRYSAEYFDDSAVKLRIITEGEFREIPLSGEKRRDIFYTVKEALHNIVKHSGATEAELSFVLNDGGLSVVIRDNGRGLPKVIPNGHGNGLNNMRQRMEAVRGSFSIENHQGTKITLMVPVM